MRRLGMVFAFAIAIMSAAGGTALAGPGDSNGHNCRGLFVASFQVPGGKDDSATEAAHLRLQDEAARQGGGGSFAANCGDNGPDLL